MRMIMTGRSDPLEQRELRRLFEDHYERLLHRARWSVRTLQDAEDLVQETFVRLVMTWPDRHDSVRNEHAFVTTVLTNVIKDFHRYTNRRPRSVGEPTEADAGLCIQPCPTDVGFDDVLSKVVSELPARQQDVIYMIYGRDLSPAMAAEKLGISAKDCHRYHHLGLRRIRERLAVTESRSIEEGRGER